MKIFLFNFATFFLIFFATNCVFRRDVVLMRQDKETFGAPIRVAPEYYYRVAPTVPKAPPDIAPVSTPATVRPISTAEPYQILSPTRARVAVVPVAAPIRVAPSPAAGYYPPYDSHPKNVKYYNPYYQEDNRSTPIKKPLPYYQEDIQSIPLKKSIP
jgi:hypothetical protein